MSRQGWPALVQRMQEYAHAGWSEWRNGLRQLVRRPGHSALIIAVLAVGLGATLFVLVVIDALVLRPMPFPDSERLVQIGEVDDDGNGELDDLNSQDLLELKVGLTQFDAIESFSNATINIADGTSVERYDGQFVSGGLFALLGVQAQIGRTIAAIDDMPAAALHVVISDRVWRQRYGANPAVIGRAVRLNSQPAEIIGVMPPRFAFPQLSDVWAAARQLPGEPSESQLATEALGRLAVGVTIDEAALQLQTVWARMQSEQPNRRRDQTLALLPATHRFVNPHSRSIFGILLIAALSVLLVACANVANLQLAQISRRSRELALRAAIGAGRTRLLIALLVETLVLCLVATLIALAIAHWAGVYTMRTFTEAGESPAYWIEFVLTPRVAFIGIGIAVLTTMAAGLMPGVRAGGQELNRTIIDHGRAGAGASRVARGLIVAQVAFSCVLLIGAGMVWRQLDARSRFDLGIDTASTQLLTARIGVFPEQFPSGAEQVAFFERVAERVRAEPGVLAATVAEALPGSTAGSAPVLIEGGDPEAPRAEVFRSAIVDQFGATYGVVPILGRLPDARDTADSQPVAVIDEYFAERWWPRQDPLNRRFKLGERGSESDWITVISVVRHLQLEDIDDPPLPAVLLPMRQAPVRFATLAVHTEATPETFAPRLAEIVREVNADTPVYWVRSLASALAADRVGDRFLTHLFGVFGIVGLLLAGAGLFGVLAQVVQARTREIGVRRAIGANTAQVVHAVAGNSARLVLWGLLAGIALGVPWAMLLAKTSLGLNPFDPTIFLTVVTLVLVAGAVAVLVPTRRALGIAPSEALRAE
ncbi:MAG TPA: ADOP family duplicated permease [Pseudomonadota bacterium]|nr:ADOP family duplicated permease [Pseudomonadota bacterium]